MGSKKRIRREQALASMVELAAGQVNDAVKLAYLSDGQANEIEALNLSALAEFKRSGTGTVEMKFLDRARILERVIELLGDEKNEAAAQFLKALEETGGEA